MKIAYSREAMHALLALQAGERAKAIETVSALAEPGVVPVARNMTFSDLLPLSDGSEFRLAPFSESGDLVVTETDDTLIVVGLGNVLGSLQEATDQ